MRKLRIILNPKDALESSCPPSKYKLSKVNSQNFSLRRLSENSPMIPAPSSNTRLSVVSPHYEKKIRLPLDLSKTRILRDITNTSQFAHRSENDKFQTDPDTPKRYLTPFSVQVAKNGPKKFERSSSNLLPNQKKSVFTRLTEGKSTLQHNNTMNSSSLPAVPANQTVFRSNLLDPETENKSTIRTSVLRRLKIQTRKVIALPPRPLKLDDTKIICIFDHDLGYLKKRLQETQNPQIQIEYHHLYPKSEEKCVQPIQYYSEFDKVFLFLNYSTCLKQKTIKASSDLSNNLGLKMCITFCCLQGSQYPNFDYDDSSISKQDRILNEFRLQVEMSEDISGGYEVSAKNFENLQDFINKKL